MLQRKSSTQNGEAYHQATQSANPPPSFPVVIVHPSHHKKTDFQLQTAPIRNRRQPPPGLQPCEAFAVRCLQHRFSSGPMTFPSPASSKSVSMECPLSAFVRLECSVGHSRNFHRLPLRSSH